MVAKLVAEAPLRSEPVNRRGPPQASTFATFGRMICAFVPNSSQRAAAAGHDPADGRFVTVTPLDETN